jgi:hypothetical protein
VQNISSKFHPEKRFQFQLNAHPAQNSIGFKKILIINTLFFLGFKLQGPGEEHKNNAQITSEFGQTKKKVLKNHIIDSFNITMYSIRYIIDQNTKNGFA